MRKLSSITAVAVLVACLSMIPATYAEVGGALTSELDGTSLTYHYTSGRRYDVKFTADTISWHRLDVPDREWESEEYIARKISDQMYYINWGRREHNEYITILLDFNKRELYTSALLEGTDRHFDVAEIVALERP